MTWKDCQQYMRTIHDLRDELSRELDVVQTNGVPRTETRTAIRRFETSQNEYWISLNTENEEQSG